MGYETHRLGGKVFFYTGYVYLGFLFFYMTQIILIVLGGEGDCLDFRRCRLLARDPPSVVGWVKR